MVEEGREMREDSCCGGGGRKDRRGYTLKGDSAGDSRRGNGVVMVGTVLGRRR